IQPWFRAELIMFGALRGSKSDRESSQNIPPARLRRVEESFRRRLSDQLEDVLHRACAVNDLETAQVLFKLLESLRIRRVRTYGSDRRINDEGIIKAEQALRACQERKT